MNSCLNNQLSFKKYVKFDIYPSHCKKARNKRQYPLKVGLKMNRRAVCRVSSDNICKVENVHGYRIRQSSHSEFLLECLLSFEDSKQFAWFV